jgi:hypothetical protein
MQLGKANKSYFYVEACAFKPVAGKFSVESVYLVPSERNLNNKNMWKIS